MREMAQPAAGAHAIRIPKRPAIMATAVLILLGLGFLYLDTFDMMPSLLPGYPGDAFFPRLILGFTAIFGALVLALGWRSIRRGEPAEISYGSDASLDWMETAIVTILSLAYALLVAPVGFEIATTAYVAALLAPRLIMPWPRALALALLAAVATTAFLYLVFVIGLKVSVPLLFLPQYLG